MQHQVHTAALQCRDTGERNSEVEPLLAVSFALAAGRGDRDRVHIAYRSMNNPDRLHERPAERTACEPHSGWGMIIGQVGTNCPVVDRNISSSAGGNLSWREMPRSSVY